MRYPIVDKERDAGIVDKVKRFLGGQIGCHDNGGVGVVGCRGEEGVVHEGDMGIERVACC